MDLKLRQKAVLITGGSSGIGKAIAIMYANEPGAQVAITYRTDQKTAAEVTDQLNMKGCSSLSVQMDLADHASIDRAVDEVAGEFGGVDVLINNAVFWGSPGAQGLRFENIPIKEWEQVIGINLLGMVKVIQAVVPFMRKKKFGRIVNVSSDIALDSMPGSGAYGTMKAALSGLTANLVTELSAANILSNVVFPSLTFTDKAVRRFPKTFREAAKNAFPTNRVTQPDDVASLIAYLGSGVNTHVNGEMIRVTGKGSQPMLNTIFQEMMTAE